MAGTDPRITNFEFDVEADRRATERLAEMGIKSPDDLGPGRADVGLIAQQLGKVDPETNPALMEEIKRQQDWVKESQAPYQPGQSETPAAQPQEPQAAADHLGALQAERDAAQAELKRMKEQYGRESTKWGDERKRVNERLARLEGGNGTGYAQPAQPVYSQSPQAGYYDPRVLGEVDPNAPLTAAQTAALLQSMAAAFGNQLNVRDQNVIEAARELRNYDLTTNEEADLIERHGWLATLDRSSQIKAMRDLVLPLRAASQPAAGAPIKPKGVDMVELARAKHLTATTYIEPSSRGSSQETMAATGTDSALAGKIAEYRKAIAARPGDKDFDADQYGANRNAERLLREISVLQRRRA